MEIIEMKDGEEREVAELYRELIYFIRKETEDVYFDIEDVSQELLTDSIRKNINNPTVKIYIAKIDNEIAGFITGEIINCFVPISKIKKIGYINTAFVYEKHRRKGIMKKLEKAITEWFKSQDIKYSELNVMTKNILGKCNWEKLGYSTFREQMRKEI